MRRSGFALVEILVVIALLALLAGGYYGFRGKSGGTDQPEQTVIGKAVGKAESVACQSNLNQLRQSIRMDVDSGEQPPARIDTGAMASVSRCPDSGQPYTYNPQTGQVQCKTPGHERY